MSSLGFVVVYLLCGPGSGDCVPANMLLQRFATAAQCRETLPEVEARILRAAPGKGFTPVCRDLDDLCRESVVGLDYGRRVRGGVSLLVSASTGGRINNAIARHLAIMCRQQRPDPGCDG